MKAFYFSNVCLYFLKFLNSIFGINHNMKFILLQPARHSKLEKADILEMTVKHLEGLRSEGSGSPDRFRAGYRHCLSEVAKFQGIEPTLRRRLVRHLEGCVTSPGSRPASAPTPPSDTEDAPQTQHSTIFISGK